MPFDLKEYPAPTPINLGLRSQRRPRTKDGSIKNGFYMKLTESDNKALDLVEKAAHAVAQVSVSCVVRRALRYYGKHLLKIAGDDVLEAIERRELQNIPKA